MSFLTAYKHIFVAISFVCVMILLYYLVYSSSKLRQSVNSIKSDRQIVTTLGSGCGKQLSSKQLAGKQVAGKPLSSKQLSSRQLSGQSPHAYSDSDYD